MLTWNTQFSLWWSTSEQHRASPPRFVRSHRDFPERINSSGKLGRVILRLLLPTWIKQNTYQNILITIFCSSVERFACFFVYAQASSLMSSRDQDQYCSRPTGGSQDVISCDKNCCWEEGAQVRQAVSIHLLITFIHYYTMNNYYHLRWCLKYLTSSLGAGVAQSVGGCAASQRVSGSRVATNNLIHAPAHSPSALSTKPLALWVIFLKLCDMEGWQKKNK